MERRIYTNLDVYHYIQRMDSPESPFHEQYQNVLRGIQGDSLENPIGEFTAMELISISPSRENSAITEQLVKFSSLLRFESAFQRVRQNPDGSYFVYPELKEIDTSDELLKYYFFDRHMSVQDVIDFLEPSIKEKKEELKKATIQNYYGTPKYLILRTNAILEAMYMLMDYAAPEDRNLVSAAIANTASFFQSMLATIGVEGNQDAFKSLEELSRGLRVTKEQYDLLRSNYVKVLECENQLMGVSNKVWKDYASAYQGVFLHQLTNGIVESDQMSKICVSFYSDNAGILTNYCGHTGYAYSMDIDSLFTMCETDVGSWTITKEEFFECGFPERVQFDDTLMYYEYPHHTKLFPPQYIEYQILMRQAFAEGVINNRKQKVKPLYCFYTEQATPEEIEAIQTIATKQGLKVKPLRPNTFSYSTYR